MSVAVGARCAKHPDVAAVEVCQRCGAFVCGDCLELFEGAPFCGDCLRRQGEGSASKRAIAALVLSIIGLNCGFLPGIAGLVLATQELSAISRNQAPFAGRTVARAARIIGLIDLALLAAAVVGAGIYGYSRLRALR